MELEETLKTIEESGGLMNEEDEDKGP